ncbi:MAG TPA: hypothetical protein VMZ02_08965 [Candidatus Limnocylindrales bacterium]|nr:hypothetical protein [Candidatus Limnocylindrales bacterium]
MAQVSNCELDGIMFAQKSTKTSLAGQWVFTFQVKPAGDYTDPSSTLGRFVEHAIAIKS